MRRNNEKMKEKIRAVKWEDWKKNWGKDRDLNKKTRMDEIRKELNNNLINADNLMLSNDNKMLTSKNGN